MSGKSVGLGLVVAGAGLAMIGLLDQLPQTAHQVGPSVTRSQIASTGPSAGLPATQLPRSTVLRQFTTDVDNESAPTGTWRPVASTATPTASPKNTRNEATERTARTSLVRAIQSELKRVGCLAGAVSGDWDGDSRQAMSAFLNRLNANLPTHQPDDILLTMLIGHKEPVCSSECPAGQALAVSGRCLPRAIVASGAAPTRAAKTKVAGSRKETSAVVAVADPVQDALSRIKLASKASALPQESPTRAETKVAATPPAPTKVEPLPGRMAIGATAPVQPESSPLAKLFAPQAGVAAGAAATERLVPPTTQAGASRSASASGDALRQQPSLAGATPQAAPEPYANPGAAARPHPTAISRRGLPAFYPPPVVSSRYAPPSGPTIQRRRDAIFTRLQTTSP